MDTKSFVKILRKVVREEVRTAVKDILGEQTVSHKKVINHGLSLQGMVEQQEHPYKPKVRKKKTFSKNKMLDDILNETAATADFGNMQQGPPASMMGDTMTTNDVSNFGSMMNSSRGIDTIPTTDVNGNTVNKNELPEHVTSALTKDYSALMKAIDKKKGGR